MSATGPQENDASANEDYPSVHSVDGDLEPVSESTGGAVVSPVGVGFGGTVILVGGGVGVIGGGVGVGGVGVLGGTVDG